jgi:hypothetical protein
MTNPTMAPRARACVICKQVTAVEHVTLLMYDEDGNRLPPKPVIDYLRSIGMTGTPKTLDQRVISHRRHIDKWIARGKVIPMEYEGAVAHIPPTIGNTRWIDAQQNAIDLGNQALRDLAARLDSGEMNTSDILALAKLGVGAANTRGAMEQKGKALNGIDRLLQLAAGGLGK